MIKTAQIGLEDNVVVGIVNPADPGSAPPGFYYVTFDAATTQVVVGWVYDIETNTFGPTEAKDE